jgi:hypothetical protein
MWWPCLLTIRDEMSNLSRWPSKDALDHISVHLRKRCQRRIFFTNQPIRNKKCIWRPCYRGPSILLTKLRFIWLSSFRKEDFFRNQLISNKNCLWPPCLLADRDEFSNLYRGPSIDASYHVSLNLAGWFQRRRFKKYRPVRIVCGGRNEQYL